MKLRIEHLTQYKYEQKVKLNLHEVYMIPLQRFYFKVLKSEIKVSPTPSGWYERVNFENNPYYQTWFVDETNELEIRASFEIQLLDFNPFGFIIHPDAEYPFSKYSYPQHLEQAISIYKIPHGFSQLEHYALSVMENSGSMVEFLVNLVASVHANWKHVHRKDPGILPVMMTFDRREGSCRDLSFMLMSMLRELGLACRFVSGYAFNPELVEGHELHAWVEVFLPGASWIGLDPSLGLFTDNQYIPLAASYNPKYASPIIGTYGGNSKSHLHAEVDIKVF
ncbi:transglutaminase family protein [Mariniradius sediminis]|uniref:Transglutaminase family protein n=1 Tax=Mariniradius sediminis TaxID=2909237 RepID=A0ABS9BUM0_9BACT|nr:transglutaminase family protein [Mariniradius sediminis]MCF1751757.1 transglutaminase family protein [Mariniradius sediminis]